MEEIVTQLSIEKAMNGYQVRLKDYISASGTSRPVPYVFETMEGLLEFIKTKLKAPNEFNFR
jgi:hypothetical protein